MKNNGWMLLALLAISSCAKDKTMDEYQREKAQQNKALLDSVSGDYSGVVYSRENGEVMGAMKLSLKPDEITTPPKDGDLAIGTPILAGSLTYLNDSKVTLSAPIGVYDQNTGAYHADLAVPGGERITVSGAISGSSISGALQAQKYPGGGGKFSLAKNGPSVEALLEQARPGQRPAPNNGLKTFNGTGKFDRDQPREMQIEVNRPQSRIDDFLDLFFPDNEKVIQVAVRFSDTVSANFPSSRWDPLSGRVEGEIAGNGYTARLVCQEFYFRATRKPFYCVYSTTRSSPIRIDFKPPY